METEDSNYWIEREDPDENVWRMGLTAHAIELLGEVQSIRVLPESENFESGEAVVEIEGANAHLEWVPAFDGVVVEVNPLVSENPSDVSEDPLEEGWLVKIEKDEEGDRSEEE